MAEGFTFGGGPLAEKDYLGDWLKWEQEGYFSRGTSTIVGSGADTYYPSGTLVEAVSAGVVKMFDGGAEVMTGILRDPVLVRVGETVPVALIIRDAVIDSRGLSTASFGGLTLAQIETRIGVDFATARIILAVKG